MYFRPRKTTNVHVAGLYPTPESRSWHGAYDFAFSTMVYRYDVHAHIVEHPSEFMNLSGLPFVSLEVASQHTQSLDDFVHPDECVYVVGNSRYMAPAHMMACNGLQRVHVPMPDSQALVEAESVLYGFQILPMVLDHRWRQRNGTGL